MNMNNPRLSRQKRQIARDIRQLPFRYSRPRHEDYLHIRFQFLSEKPERLAHQALGAVPIYGERERPLRYDDAGLSAGTRTLPNPHDHRLSPIRLVRIENDPVTG